MNDSGEAKLTGACLPRHANFPQDADKINTDTFVYLSPEVLKGDLYTSSDDWYSFGLVVWETCLPNERPYDKQRDSMKLSQFKNQVGYFGDLEIIILII